MHFSIHQITDGEDELILKYKQMNKDVEKILAFMERHERKLMGKAEGQTVIFSPEDILYIEKVDEKTFVYTSEQVIQIEQSLATVEEILDDRRYFRCSKSMIININKIERLRSLPSNRIDATMLSGEHIIISRTYASDFRKRLKGE